MTKEKILAIGENTFGAKIQESLWNYNFDISVASNGLDAINSVQNSFFKIILIEADFSAIDTIDICKILKDSQNYPFHIIVILSIENDNLIEEFLKVGVDDFLDKNFYKDELILKIRTHLNMLKQDIFLFKVAKNKIKKQNKSEINSQQSDDNNLHKAFIFKASQLIEFGFQIINSKNIVMYENKISRMITGGILFKNYIDFYLSKTLSKDQKTAFNPKDIRISEEQEIWINGKKMMIVQLPLEKSVSDIAKIIVLKPNYHKN